MTEIVQVQEAKTRLSAILSAVERGAEVVIARGDTPVARLTPIAQVPDRQWGFVPYEVPPSFFEELPNAEIDAWQQ